MRELSLFSGAGGGLLGTVHLLGWRPVGYVEWDEYCCRVLEQRIKDGLLPRAPIYQMDIREFNRRVAERYRGVVDVVTGGFPCVDISSAGKKTGIEGPQSSLWKEMAATVRLVRPRYVLVENSAALVSRGLGVVLGDLAEMGYDATWGSIQAASLGAPHSRDRTWIVGDSNGDGKPELPEHEQVAVMSSTEDAEPRKLQVGRHMAGTGRHGQPISWDRLWPHENSPLDPGVDDGMAHRMDRLRALGNGQVPAVAAAAWRLLSGMTPPPGGEG